MRDLLASAIKKIGANSGIGSYIKDGFGTAKPFDALQAKKRFGNDSFSHECGIVERTVGGKHLRYVMVGLGSAPAQGRADLSALFRRMDDAIIARNP
jgi:hypothetical protein